MGQINYDAKAYPVDLFALEHLTYGLLENDSVAPVHYPDGFRYINIHSDKPVINQVFEVAYPFARNFGLVKLGGKYGVINRDGSLVVKPGFDHFQLFDNLNYGFYFNDENFFSPSRGELIKQPEILCGEPVAPHSSPIFPSAPSMCDCGCLHTPPRFRGSRRQHGAAGRLFRYDDSLGGRRVYCAC